MWEEGDHVHVGGNIPRDYAIDLDVLLAPFVGEGLGELAEGTLGGCVRRNREASLNR